jgi:uncharacterized protein HemX
MSHDINADYDTQEQRMNTATESRVLSHLALIVTLIIGFCFSTQASAQAAGDKTTVAQISQQTQDLLKSLKAYSVEQRDEALQQAKAALDNLDERIDQLETGIVNDWDKMDAVRREQSRLSLKAMRDQRMHVAEWYGSLKQSSAGAWGQIKTGFSSAYSVLHDTWQKTEKEFSSDE